MSKKVRFELKVPDNLFDEELTQEEFKRELRIDAAIKLFQKGLVSSGYAAEMIGTTKRDFMELLRERGIPFVDMTEEELKEEWKNVSKMEQQLRRERGK